MSNRLTGSIKWFDEVKGYGFIVTPGHPADVFIHRQQMLNSGVDFVKQGETVSFVLQTGRKGVYATAIQRES